MSNMHDEWIPGRPLFHFKNALHRFSIKCVRGQSIDRLCGNSNKAAPLENDCGFGDCRMVLCGFLRSDLETQSLHSHRINTPLTFEQQRSI